MASAIFQIMARALPNLKLNLKKAGTNYMGDLLSLKMKNYLILRKEIKLLLKK